MLSSSVMPAQTKPVRIVIADDHPFFIDGFCVALRKHTHVAVTGTALNGEQLIKLVEEVLPDVVFTDIQMPVKDGIAVTKEIKERFPYINVIGISAFAEDCMITEMMEAGASGYILKNESIEGILAAIEKVMSGELYYSLEVSNRLVALMQRTSYNPMKPFEKPRLTELEISVMKETCNGLSSKEVATKLQLEVRSVESAKARIIEKTGCRNSVGMVRYAVRNFIIQP